MEAAPNAAAARGPIPSETAAFSLLVALLSSAGLWLPLPPGGSARGLAVGGVCGVLVATTLLFSDRATVAARLLAASALGALSAGVLLPRVSDPRLGLVVLVALATSLALLAGWFEPHRLQRARSGPRSTRIAVVTGVAGLAVLLVADGLAVPGIAWALAACVPVAVAAVLDRWRGLLPGGALRDFGLTLALVAAALGMRAEPPSALWALAPLGVLGWRSRTTSPSSSSRGTWSALVGSPARLLVTTFAVICVAGTGLLSLPSAQVGETSFPLIDLAFTAVSATCVTGLAVLDTPNAFTWSGQLALLLLIQVGGLGIMTFATAGLMLAGQRLSVREERVAAQLLGPEARRDLGRAVREVWLVTGATEAIGTLCLLERFLARGEAFRPALWRALFTSISAFCNAGFALQSDSLVGFQRDPLLLFEVSAIIVLGSLGPVVVVALFRRRARPGRLPKPLTLRVRLVLLMSALLLVVPSALIAMLEWNGTLAGLSAVERLANAWFQAVTLRTAGFNSIDLAAVQPATWSIMVVCMFIGGSPGSTAGGVKTTTIAVLTLAVAATVRGRASATAFGRRIHNRTVFEAGAILSVGALSAGAALFALQLTQRLPLDVALFEAVSAVATVGLTTGATGELDGVGKVIIMACMFAGRVGPLSLFVFLAGRDHSVPTVQPIELVPVG